MGYEYTFDKKKNLECCEESDLSTIVQREQER